MITSTLILVGLELWLVVAVWTLGERTRTSLALALMCLTAPLEVYRADAGLGNLSLFRLSLAIALCVVLVDHRRRVRDVLSTPFVIAFAGLAVAMVVSAVAMSDNHRLALALAAQAVASVVAIATVGVLARDVPLSKLARLIVIGVTLPILGAAAQGFLGANGTFSLPLLAELPVPDGLEVTRQNISVVADAQRLRGTFGDPNHLGAYLSLVAALCLALLVHARLRLNPRSALGYGAMTVGVMAILAATLSRSAWAGCAAALAVAAILVVADRDLRARAARRWPVLVAGLIVCLVAVAPLAPAVLKRLDSGRVENRASDDTHRATTRVALQTYADHPLFGIGLADLGPVLGEGERTSGAHSSYLTIGSETGSIGLALLLAGIALVVRTLWIARRAARATTEAILVIALLAAYLGFLVSNAFYDLWWDDFHAVFLGAILALSLRTRDTTGVVSAVASRLDQPAGPPEPATARPTPSGSLGRGESARAHADRAT